MTTQALQTNPQESQVPAVPVDMEAQALIQAVGMGDVTQLNPEQRLKYIGAICRSRGLNPLTLPIRIIKLDGRDTLYATAECGAQLRHNESVSIKLVDRREEGGCYIVVAQATRPDGRVDEATGAVSLIYPEKIKEWRGGQSTWVAHPNAGKKLAGLDYANAIKKAETQAKRRVALSICGLGLPDESEVDDMKRVNGDVITTTETAQDRAAMLNNAISQPIDVETISGAASPKDGATLTPTAAPSESPVKSGAASGGESRPQEKQAATRVEVTAEVKAGNANQPAREDLPKAVLTPPTGIAEQAKQQTAPQPSALSASPATVAVPEGFTTPDGLLTDEVVFNINTVLTEKDIKTAIRYLVAKGKLKPDEMNKFDLARLDHQAANFILKKPARFHQWVNDWVKAGGDAAKPT